VRGGDLSELEYALEAQFDLPVRILDPLPEPAGAYDAGRRQYNSALILRSLAETCPADAWRLLAITECDLFIPMLSFVFGQAQLGGRVALVSMARLRQEFYGLPPVQSILAGRARKEALHELGHTFGLVHCAERKCPMSLSTGVAQVDGKGHTYCQSCISEIQASQVPLIRPEKVL
jgi:archaemetzincin